MCMCVSISKLNRKHLCSALVHMTTNIIVDIHFRLVILVADLDLVIISLLASPLFENLGLNWHSVAFVFTCHLLIFLWQMYQGRVCGSRFLTYWVIL